MDISTLLTARDRIQADPRSGQSLLLYALIKTLSIPQGGHAYLLTKLKEMNPDTRRLAYALMELMVLGGPAQAEWQQVVAQMDAAIAGQ
jgi:hypothetical protein